MFPYRNDDLDTGEARKAEHFEDDSKTLRRFGPQISISESSEPYSPCSTTPFFDHATDFQPLKVRKNIIMITSTSDIPYYYEVYNI